MHCITEYHRTFLLCMILCATHTHWEFYNDQDRIQTFFLFCEGFCSIERNKFMKSSLILLFSALGNYREYREAGMHLHLFFSLDLNLKIFHVVKPNELNRFVLHAVWMFGSFTILFIPVLIALQHLFRTRFCFDCLCWMYLHKIMLHKMHASELNCQA